MFTEAENNNNLNPKNNPIYNEIQQNFDKLLKDGVLDENEYKIASNLNRSRRDDYNNKINYEPISENNENNNKINDDYNKWEQNQNKLLQQFALQFAENNTNQNKIATQVMSNRLINEQNKMFTITNEGLKTALEIEKHEDTRINQIITIIFTTIIALTAAFTFLNQAKIYLAILYALFIIIGLLYPIFVRR